MNRSDEILLKVARISIEDSKISSKLWEIFALGRSYQRSMDMEDSSRVENLEMPSIDELAVAPRGIRETLERQTIISEEEIRRMHMYRYVGSEFVSPTSPPEEDIRRSARRTVGHVVMDKDVTEGTFQLPTLEEIREEKDDETV